MRKFLDVFMPLMLGVLASVGMIATTKAVVRAANSEPVIKCQTTCQDATRENVKRWTRENCESMSCYATGTKGQFSPPLAPKALSEKFVRADLKFHFGDRVRFTSGVYATREGVVIDWVKDGYIVDVSCVAVCEKLRRPQWAKYDAPTLTSVPEECMEIAKSAEAYRPTELTPVPTPEPIPIPMPGLPDLPDDYSPDDYSNRPIQPLESPHPNRGKQNDNSP